MSSLLVTHAGTPAAGERGLARALGAQPPDSPSRTPASFPEPPAAGGELWRGAGGAWEVTGRVAQASLPLLCPSAARCPGRGVPEPHPGQGRPETLQLTGPVRLSGTETQVTQEEGRGTMSRRPPAPTPASSPHSAPWSELDLPRLPRPPAGSLPRPEVGAITTSAETRRLSDTCVSLGPATVGPEASHLHQPLSCSQVQSARYRTDCLWPRGPGLGSRASLGPSAAGPGAPARGRW